MPERREARAGLGEERVGVAVVAARELEHPVRRVNARASRSADIAASVPDETSRTCSIDGTASAISAASSTSRSVGAPKLVPSSAAVAHRLDRLRVGMPEDQRPPGLHPVEQAAAVGRLEVGALAARDEERLVDADGAHRADRRVHAARDQLLRAVPELGAVQQLTARRRALWPST